MEENIEWYIEKGAHGLIPLGSTGEFASLTEKERYKIAEFVVKVTKNRVPVCIGTTSETTAKTLEYTQHAEKIGADAVLILPPYYFNPLFYRLIILILYRKKLFITMRQYQMLSIFLL